VRLAGLAEGQNLLKIDTHELERMVEAHPWVAKAEVERVFPSAIEIRVVEHEPAVVVALGHLYYANDRGEIVKRYTPGENEKLPVVTGLTRDEIETDDGDARARLLSAIELKKEIEAVMGERAPKLAEIHLDRALGVSFVPSDEDVTVVMGAPPWKTSIERYLKVRGALAEKGVRASRIVVGGERRPDRAVAKLSTTEKGEALGPALVSLE
jgi:cell division protein FtsQ